MTARGPQVDAVMAALATHQQHLSGWPACRCGYRATGDDSFNDAYDEVERHRAEAVLDAVFGSDRQDA